MHVHVCVCVCEGERDADCVSGCLCVSPCTDRDLDESTVMVWRPESDNKARKFTQRTKGEGGVDRRKAW